MRKYESTRKKFAAHPNDPPGFKGEVVFFELCVLLHQIWVDWMVEFPNENWGPTHCRSAGELIRGVKGLLKMLTEMYASRWLFNTAVARAAEADVGEVVDENDVRSPGLSARAHAHAAGQADAQTQRESHRQWCRFHNFH